MPCDTDTLMKLIMHARQVWHRYCTCGICWFSILKIAVCIPANQTTETAQIWINIKPLLWVWEASLNSRWLDVAVELCHHHPPILPEDGGGCCYGGVMGGSGCFKRLVFVHLSFLPWLQCAPHFKVWAVTCPPWEWVNPDFHSSFLR